MPTTCTVSGVLYDATGDTLLTGAVLTFQRTDGLQNVEGRAVAPVFGVSQAGVTTVTTHASTAAFSVDLAPGNYQISYQGVVGVERRRLIVPAASTADFENLLETATPPDSTVIASFTGHLASTANPHNVTAAQVGLGDVDNTSDADKPISTATQAALDPLQAHRVSTANPHQTTGAQIAIPTPRASDGDVLTGGWRWGVTDRASRALLAVDDWSNMALGSLTLEYSVTNSHRLIWGLVDTAGALLAGVDRDGGQWQGAVYVGQTADNSLHALWSATDGSYAASLWVDKAGRARAALEDSVVYVSGGNVFEVAGVNRVQLTDRGDVLGASNVGDGRFRFAALRGGEPILFEAHKSAPATIRVAYETRRVHEFVAITGQSLAEGADTAATTTEFYPANALRFENGPVGKQGEVTGPAVVPLREQTNETIATGFARTWLNTALDRTLLVGGQAWGGKTYDELKKGATDGVYEKILDQMRLAANQPGGAHMRAVFLVHGEADGLISNATYDDDLVEWLGDFDADAAAIFGQRDGLVMLLCQTSSVSGYRDATAARDGFTTPFLQTAAAEANARIFCVGPKYQYTYLDHSHIDAASTRDHGALYAKVARRVIEDGVDWKPVQPNTVTVSGSDVIIDFDVPVGPLVLDTTAVTDPGNSGFTLLDAGGATITGVAVTGAAQVTVTLSAAPSAGWRLSYAFHNGTYETSGATTGARGNIRDSDATINPFTGNPLRNWCVAFQHTF